VSILRNVPRNVAVVANRFDPSWEMSLAALPAQYLTVSVYKTALGLEAVEVSGVLEATESNIGFGTFSAVDRSIVFAAQLNLPDGLIQINDPRGSVGTWVVRREHGQTWITKEAGVPTLPNGVLVQLLRTHSGATLMKIPGKHL
jgi:hypothetical protein